MTPRLRNRKLASCELGRAYCSDVILSESRRRLSVDASKRPRANVDEHLPMVSRGPYPRINSSFLLASPGPPRARAAMITHRRRRRTFRSPRLTLAHGCATRAAACSGCRADSFPRYLRIRFDARCPGLSEARRLGRHKDLGPGERARLRAHPRCAVRRSVAVRPPEQSARSNSKADAARSVAVGERTHKGSRRPAGSRPHRQPLGRSRKAIVKFIAHHAIAVAQHVDAQNVNVRRRRGGEHSLSTNDNAACSCRRRLPARESASWFPRAGKWEIPLTVRSPHRILGKSVTTIAESRHALSLARDRAHSIRGTESSSFSNSQSSRSRSGAAHRARVRHPCRIRGESFKRYFVEKRVELLRAHRPSA